jgi:hypothetical protein
MNEVEANPEKLSAAACCGGTTPEDDACCPRDAQAKAAGEAGCGCGEPRTGSCCS